MTLGRVSSDVRDVTRNLRGLEDRLTAVEEAQAHADRRFVRLLLWLGLVGFVGGGLVVLVYLIK